MEPDDGQDARARSGGLHWRPYHSWNCHHQGIRTRSASTSTWPPPTGLHPLEPTSHGGSSDRGLPMHLGGLPSIGRQTVGPRASGQRVPALPMQVPSAPWEMLPVHQLRPHQPATPYQQAVQPLNQSATPYQQAVQPQSQPTAPYEQLMQPSSQPATPYQQAVQLPRRPAGRGLLA